MATIGQPMALSCLNILNVVKPVVIKKKQKSKYVKYKPAKSCYKVN